MDTYTNNYNETYTDTVSPKVPGKKGTIARLIVLGIVALIGILSSILTLPEYTARRGFGLALLEAFGGCGALFLLAAFIWGFMKWISFMGPKSLGAANRFWQAWIPLTFLGVYIKACIWLIVTVVPCSIYGMLMVPLFTVTQHFTEVNIGFFSAMGLFLGGAALVMAVGFVDICKLRRVSPMAVVKEKLAAGK